MLRRVGSGVYLYKLPAKFGKWDARKSSRLLLIYSRAKYDEVCLMSWIKA